MSEIYDNRIIGKTLYVVKNTGAPTIIEQEIIGVKTIKENGILKSELLTNEKIYLYWRDKQFLSEKKANNYLNQLLKQREKWVKQSVAYEKLKEQLPNYDYLKGLWVNLRTSKSKNEWTKHKIKSVQVVYRGRGHAIGFWANENLYLLEKEGKNWEFIPELNELLLKEHELEKELKEIKDKIKQEGVK